MSVSEIAPFANHLPVRIRFGEGVAAELPALAAAEGARVALVVVDDGLEAVNEPVAAALAGLEAAGVEVVRSLKAAGEPTDAQVDAAAAGLAESEAGIVIAIGGGSAMDTAKAARLCAQLGIGFAEYAGAGIEIPVASLPLVAVPTTAGTGSEVSGGAVITDSGSGRKAGIAHPNLRATHALVDPVLTHSVPVATTAYTGVDALAQAIAGMVAKVRTPIGDAIALESIRLAYRALPAACADGSDAAARSEMACASLLAGLTMNLSDCSAEHSLAQALGGRTKAPHGLTIGLVLAETLEREQRYAPAQLERVADAMGVPDDDSGDGSRAVAGVRDLLRRLEFPVLSSLEVTDADLDELTALALADFFITQAPEPWTGNEVREAFEAALRLAAR